MKKKLWAYLYGNEEHEKEIKLVLTHMLYGEEVHFEDLEFN